MNARTTSAVVDASIYRALIFANVKKDTNWKETDVSTKTSVPLLDPVRVNASILLEATAVNAILATEQSVTNALVTLVFD